MVDLKIINFSYTSFTCITTHWLKTFLHESLVLYFLDLGQKIKYFCKHLKYAYQAMLEPEEIYNIKRPNVLIYILKLQQCFKVAMLIPISLHSLPFDEFDALIACDVPSRSLPRAAGNLHLFVTPTWTLTRQCVVIGNCEDNYIFNEGVTNRLVSLA